MAADISTKTREGGVTIGISYYFILSLGVPLRFALTGLIVLVLSSLTAPSYANNSEPMPAKAIDPTLPGARVGMLTRTQGMLFIDRTAYILAPIALVEDRFGTPLSIQDLQCNEAKCRVQYWTAPALGPDQIVQLIVTFPE